MSYARGLPIVALAVTAVIASAGVADSQDRLPRVTGAVPIEIQDDWNYDSDDADNEHNQLFTKIEPEATLRLTPGLSLFAHAVIESVREAAPGESRAFEDEGIFVEDLFVRYERGRYALQGGKFTPAFGIGWDATPGIWGTDFAEAGYEFAERIGIAASAAYGSAEAGAHTLTAHTFFVDTSILAESLGRGRGTTDKIDGGVGNTEDFTSYAVTLDGENVAGLEGLGYRIAYIRQAPGRGDETDEKGFSVALSHGFGLGAGVTLSPMVEFVRFDDAEGVSGQDRDFVTVAADLAWRNWNLALALTERDTEAADGTRTDNFQFQVSVGYAFDFGLSVDFGWHIANEDHVEVRRLGALLAYTVEF